MEYKLGALKNKKDLRDIQLVQVQAPVSIPSKFITDISWIPVMNQKSIGACVGHAHALIHIYNEFKENNLKEKLSPRYLYALSKKIDGVSGEGTYPRVTASIMFNKGCTHEGFCFNNTSLSHADYINVSETPEMTKDALKYKIKGYAFVANNKDAIKQAIYQNGLVAITISVGNFDNPIKPGNMGLHRVTLYGYDNDRFFYRNSWGEEWGDKGNGYFDWGQQDLSDIMSFVDMPNQLLEDVKKKYRYFSEAEVTKWKLKPEMWQLLDKLRDECGFPFIIESGLRTQKENDALQMSASNSAHLSGLAADIRVANDSQRNTLEKVARANGIRRMGIGENFIHIDIDSTKPQDVTWTYYKYYTKKSV